MNIDKAGVTNWYFQRTEASGPKPNGKDSERAAARKQILRVATADRRKNKPSLPSFKCMEE